MKTPLGKELVINNKALALAVAEEWEMQKEDIKTDTMHLVWWFKIVLNWNKEQIYVWYIYIL